MAHHAYVAEGSAEDVITRARVFAQQTLGVPENSPDFISYAFGQLSVEDARRVTGIAQQSGTGATKVIVLHANRLFHQAQNALLKIFEEPPAGVVIILGVPTTGMLLPTLQSRLIPLPEIEGSQQEIQSHAEAHTFLSLGTPEREKYLSKLIDRTKADNESTKNAARAEAVSFLQSLTALAHEQMTTGSTEQQAEVRALLEDLTAFMPLLHERSVPYKLIFEHLLLVIPKGLKGAKV